MSVLQFIYSKVEGGVQKCDAGCMKSMLTFKLLHLRDVDCHDSWSLSPSHYSHLFCTVCAQFHILPLAAESYYWASLTSASTTVGPWHEKLIKNKVQSKIPQYMLHIYSKYGSQGKREKFSHMVEVIFKTTTRDERFELCCELEAAGGDAEEPTCLIWDALQGLC